MTHCFFHIVALSHCGNCELNSNLWLCLTCGFLGCGRCVMFGYYLITNKYSKQYDGSGGNNHAVEHAREAQHWVACKIGTISPDGHAGM